MKVTHLNWVLLAAGSILILWFVGAVLEHNSALCPRKSDQAAFGCAEFWLYRYQTLLAGVLALAAAILSVRVVDRQIKQAAKWDRRNRRRSLDASLAVLPLHLSAISDFEKKCVDELSTLLRRPNVMSLIDVTDADLHWPTFDHSTISGLQHVIESARSAERRQIASMIEDLQVHLSRLRDINTQRAWSVYELETYVLDGLEIYAKAALVFDYARREEDSIPRYITADNMKSAMNILRYRGWASDQFVDRIDRTYPKPFVTKRDRPKPPPSET